MAFVAVAVVVYHNLRMCMLSVDLERASSIESF